MEIINNVERINCEIEKKRLDSNGAPSQETPNLLRPPVDKIQMLTKWRRGHALQGHDLVLFSVSLVKGQENTKFRSIHRVFLVYTWKIVSEVKVRIASS